MPALPKSRPDQPPRVLKALHEIAVAVGGVLDPASLAELVSERARELLGADAVALQVWDEEGGVLRPLYASDARRLSSYPPTPLGLGTTGYALQRREPVVVDDYQSWEHALPWFREAGVQATMAVPLMVADRAIGALGVRFYSTHTLTPDELHTLLLLAAQIGPVLEAARLHAATEARRVEAEGLAELMRRGAGASSVEPLLDLVADTAARLLGASSAGVDLVDGDGAPHVRGGAASHLVSQGRGAVLPAGSISARALAAGNTVVLDRLAEDPWYSQEPLASLVSRSARTLLATPLAGRDRAQGTLVVSWHDDVVVGADQQRLAETLARYAATIIDSTDARERAERAQQGLAFLAQASKRLARSLDYEDTLDSISKLLVPGLADLSAVDVVGDNGQVQRLAVAHVDPAKTELVREMQRRYPLDAEGPCGIPNVLRTGVSELYEQVSSESLLTTARDEQHRRMLAGLGITSAMYVPVRAQDNVLGVISLLITDSARRYTREDLALAEELASRAALAIENARLYRAAQGEIRERKEAEAALRAAERQALQAEKLRAVGQMASGIAHDLNQSLALVAGYSDLARRALDQQPPDVEHLRETLDVVARAAMDGGETVKRLLTFARSRSDQPAEHVDVAALLRDVARLTAPRWRDAAQEEGRPISLHVETMGELVVSGSAAGLKEALANLVFNAVDALPEGGTIRLSGEARGSCVAVEVADNGQGMPPEVESHIFEPFFTTKGDRGTGLGLAQVYGIVEMHGGRISVASRAGEGTTFHIELPTAVEDAPAAEAPSSAPERHGLRVLAVDDEPALARMVGLLLSPHGHTVDTATSGETALDRLAQQSYDVVVSDVGMGDGMNGWDLAARIGQQWPGLRVVLATGWGAQIDPRDASRRGVAAVVPKPYRLEQLLMAVTGTEAAA